MTQKFLSILQTGILNSKEPLQILLSLINAETQKIRAPRNPSGEDKQDALTVAVARRR